MTEIRSFRDVLRLFYLFRRDFWWAFGITVVLIGLGAFLLPARYASEARLMVKPGRENLSVPIDAPGRQTFAPQSTQRDPIVDEEKILTGSPIVAKVSALALAELGAGPPPATFWKRVKQEAKEFVGSITEHARTLAASVGLVEPSEPQERLARKLTKAFDVKHTPGSAVMEIQFTWDDPAVAQRVLDHWVRAYMDERARILGRGDLVRFYAEKTDTAAQQVDALKKQLQDRLEQLGGISTRERLSTLTERLNMVRERLADASAELSSLRRGVDASDRMVARLPAEVLTEREAGPDAAWLALNTQISELKRQRVEAMRTFTDSSPAVRAIDESIAVLEQRSRTEVRDAPRMERRSANAVSASLQRGALEKTVRVEELSALVSAHGRELAKLEGERQRVMSAEPELARLERELTTAEKNNTLYLESLEKARIDEALDASRISNVAMVVAPTFNPSRIFPKSLVLLLAALPAGLAVGLLVIYLRSLLDQRVHDGARIESRFGVPLWSTIKALTRRGDLDTVFYASIIRIYGHLPLDQIARQGLTLALTSARPGEGVHFIGRALQRLLLAEKIDVVIDPPEGLAVPGQIALMLAPGFEGSRGALAKLRLAEMIVLVVESRSSTIPQVEHALRILSSACGKVDGVIVNRRQFEIPARVMRSLGM